MKRKISIKNYTKGVKKRCELRHKNAYPKSSQRSIFIINNIKVKLTKHKRKIILDELSLHDVSKIYK